MFLKILKEIMRFFENFIENFGNMDWGGRPSPQKLEKILLKFT